MGNRSGTFKKKQDVLPMRMRLLLEVRLPSAVRLISEPRIVTGLLCPII
jgi:hypothetical protein